jgi:hypothetical protein
MAINRNVILMVTQNRTTNESISLELEFYSHVENADMTVSTKIGLEQKH